MTLLFSIIKYAGSVIVVNNLSEMNTSSRGVSAQLTFPVYLNRLIDRH